MTYRRIAVNVFGLLVGIALFAWWVARHDSELRAVGSLHVQWLLLGFLFMLFSPVIQLMRTSLLLEQGLASVRHSVLVCHGVNAVAPVVGDFLEITWLARVSDLSMARVTERCVWRSAFTLAATLVLIGIAVGLPGIAVVSLVGLFLATKLRDRIVPENWRGARAWLGSRAFGIQFGLILLQLLVEGTAFLFVSFGVGLSLDMLTALGVRSVVEWTTYLPIPLSGLGVHHAGITESVGLFGAEALSLGVQAVVHHGMWLLSSIGVGCWAWVMFTSAREEA